MLIHQSPPLGNIWYLNWSDDQQSYCNGERANIRKTKKGYWKCIDAIRIPTSTSIVGVKFNLEFYEGEPPSGKRTQWVMHEYQLEQNDEANVPQSLRTIFLQGNKKLNTEDGLVTLSSNCPYDCMESEMEEWNTATNSQVVDERSSDVKDISTRSRDMKKAFKGFIFTSQ